jgi:hypothetical protein
MRGFNYSAFMQKIWGLRDPHTEFRSTGDSLVIRVDALDNKDRRRVVLREYLHLHLETCTIDLTEQIADGIIRDLTKPMGWTRKQPTTAGHYWLVDRDTGSMQVAEVTICDGEARMFTPLGGRINPLDISWWSESPMEAPEEPDDC